MGYKLQSYIKFTGDKFPGGNMNIPNQWQQGIGESSTNYYDKWFYREDCKYEIHVWWDKGNNHCVEIIPIKGINQDGDPVYETPKETCEFDTEDEAIEYACDLMEKYT